MVNMLNNMKMALLITLLYIGGAVPHRTLLKNLHHCAKLLYLLDHGFHILSNLNEVLVEDALTLFLALELILCLVPCFY